MIKNDAIGNDNRDLFLKNGICTINMISSPGAGKTTLLENSLAHFTSRFKTAIIEGDLYTSKDAERLARYKIPLFQINTEGGCHLDAKMIHQALKDLSLEEIELLIIENVGNLVCPAAFDLGEGMRVLLYSVTEGADKPEKYETMFKSAQVVVINKCDLAEPCNIDLDELEKTVRKVNPTCKIFQLSATKPETLTPWLEWMEKDIRRLGHRT